jgi:hypothetical protein
MRMPFAFWNAVAGLAEILPQPPLTRNQVELMQIDTMPQRTGLDFAHSEFLHDRLKKNWKQCSSIAKLRRKRLSYQVEAEEASLP